MPRSSSLNCDLVRGILVGLFSSARLALALGFLVAAVQPGWAQGGESQPSPNQDPVEIWSSELARVIDQKAEEADRAVRVAEELRSAHPGNTGEIGSGSNISVNKWPRAYARGLYEKASALGLVTEEQDRVSLAHQPRAASASGRARHFTPMILAILREHGLPESLAAIPLVESGFDPEAQSPKGARGLWQLMPHTARRFGLNPEAPFDERLDPVRSTHAAARYLKELYRIWGDWALALAAYNAGEARVHRALLRSKGKDFGSLASSRLLPDETINYVPAVLAAMRQTAIRRGGS